MTERDIPALALTLSVFAGIIILISGFLILSIGPAFIGAMIGEYPALVENQGLHGFILSMVVGLGLAGIIFGLTILIGSYMLYSHPESHALWGIVILIVSVASFLEGGGFLAGAILGMIGAILAIAWKPPELESGRETDP